MNKLYIVLTIFSLAFSCTIQKRNYMSGYHLEWKKTKRNLLKHNQRNHSGTNENFLSPLGLRQSEVTQFILRKEHLSFENKSPRTKSSQASLKRSSLRNKKHKDEVRKSDSCDVLVKKNGDEIQVKVLELTTDEVKYRKCEHLDGPIYVALKSEVFMIKYANGTKDVMPAKEPPAPQKKEFKVRKTEALGVLGFISSLVGLFVAALPLGALAVIFGSVSLSKIAKHPDELRGKGFGVAAIVIGLLDVIAGLIILALMI